MQQSQNIFIFSAYTDACTSSCKIVVAFDWLGGKRGAGVRGTGYGVPGCGKRGVWWKTRGVENAGSGGKRGVPFFRQNMNFPQ